MKKFYAIGHPLHHPGYNFGANGGSSKSKQSSTQQQTSFSGIKDPFTLDAIKQIITAGGLTPELAGQRDTRTATRNAALDAAGRFTRENAFSDAQGAVDQIVRQQNEANRPVIARAVEGAGMSGGSMAALLTNDATTRSAQAGATLSAQLAAQYGNIQAGNLQTAANLSQIDTSSIDALLKAISGMQVSESQGTASSKGSSSSFNAGFTLLGG